VLLLLVFTPRAYGWGGEGHQVVALIAENHLSDAAKVGIHELLGADVNISDAQVASWADQIRRERRATAPWHYVDIPVESLRAQRVLPTVLTSAPARLMVVRANPPKIRCCATRRAKAR